MAQDQVPGNNGRRVPQTWMTSTTRTQPSHGRRCHAINNPAMGAHHDAPRQEGEEAEERQEKQDEGEAALM